jgi:hypothetical protein
MHTKAFLILNRYGVVRVTKRPPALTRGEIGLRLAVIIPDECFAGPLVDVAVEVASDQVRPAEVTFDIEDAEAGQ